MTVAPTTGYVGSLTPKEEASLREMWTLLFTTVTSLLSSVYEVKLPESSPNDIFKLLDKITEPSIDGILAVLKNPPEANGETASETTPNGATIEQSLDKMKELASKANGKEILDKLSKTKLTQPQLSGLMTQLRKSHVNESEIKTIEKILLAMSPGEMIFTVLKLVKQEHPDTLLLRFLRARKWDVPKAFGMMANAILWRQKMQVDDDIVPKGELHAWQQSRDEKLSKAEQKGGKDFISQLEMGKSYLHGLDREGRPVNVVRVRLHKPGAQSEEALERYIVHVIESTRILVAPPVETGVCIHLKHCSQLARQWTNCDRQFSST